MDKLTEYLEVLNEQQRRSYGSQIKKYLEWRKISIEELLQHGVEEMIYFEQYLDDPKVIASLEVKRNRVMSVKRFMRFQKIEIPLFMKKNKGLYYKDDQAMQNYLVFVGSAASTQKEANRAIYYYCKFREKTPTEILKEAKIITITDIRIYLMKFYRSMDFKSSWKFVNYVKRFYEFLADIIIRLPSQGKNKAKKKTLNIDGIIIDKPFMRELLEVADVRDTLILFALFESGINPVDLVVLNYGDLKDHLDLEEPMNCDMCAVIKHTRQKTGYDFPACFGPGTLKAMSKFLMMRKKGYFGWVEEITDDTPIFTLKKPPFRRMLAHAITQVILRKCKQAGKEKVTSADFRNSFNTRTKKILKHYDKELFMGHSGGLERHYDVSKMQYFLNEYTQAWELLFDLSFDNEKVQAMEEELKETKESLGDLTNLIEEILLTIKTTGKTSMIEPENLDEALRIVRTLKEK
ncbi:MAG: hypothetical protein ACTSPO_16035 [Candidatus Heimdallarchaeaceae archaeon]